MNDAGFVRRRETGSHLPDDREGFVRGHAASSCEMLIECFAVQQLHREEGDIVGSVGVVKEIKNPAHIGMRYFSGKLNLTLEAFHRVGNARNLRADRL